MRIRKSHGRVREAGADYLAYALLDAVMDAYFPVLEMLGVPFLSALAPAASKAFAVSISFQCAAHCRAVVPSTSANVVPGPISPPRQRRWSRSFAETMSSAPRHAG